MPIPPRLERALGWVLTTPSFHGVHHQARQPYTDTNYGFVFSFWDAAFGTTLRRTLAPGIATGLDDHDDAPLSRLLVNPLLLRAPYAEAAR